MKLAASQYASRNTAWPPLNRPPNSTTLEKLYNQALKEVHKLKSPIQPNLSKKRHRSISNNDENHARQHDDWIEPKKTIKNSKTNTYNESVYTQNQYAVLYADNEVDMLSQYDEKEEESPAFETTRGQCSQNTG